MQEDNEVEWVNESEFKKIVGSPAKNTKASPPLEVVEKDGKKVVVSKKAEKPKKEVVHPPKKETAPASSPKKDHGKKSPSKDVSTHKQLLESKAEHAPEKQEPTTQASITAADSVEDEHMVISKPHSKKEKKLLKKREKMEKQAEAATQEEDGANKKVRFDLTQNKITEFFKHGKVAQRVLYSSQ